MTPGESEEDGVETCVLGECRPLDVRYSEPSLHLPRVSEHLPSLRVSVTVTITSTLVGAIPFRIVTDSDSDTYTFLCGFLSRFVFTVPLGLLPGLHLTWRSMLTW